MLANRMSSWNVTLFSFSQILPYLGFAHVRQAKIAQDTFTSLIVEQEVCRLDIPVHDPSLMYVFQSTEKRLHIASDMIGVHMLVEMLHLISFDIPQ